MFDKQYPLEIYNSLDLTDTLDDIMYDSYKIKSLSLEIYDEIYQYRDPEDTDTIRTDKMSRIREYASSILELIDKLEKS